MNLTLRRMYGRVARLFSPGYGSCYRCTRPWTVCKEHITNYTEYGGCFPLCKECWTELTPETRLPFYLDLYLDWQRQGCESNQWNDIEKAVQEGK